VGRALEAMLLTPTTVICLGYGRIYCILLRLPKNYKQYEIMINDYSAYSYMDFPSMMFASLNGRTLWVQGKHLYYILQYVMFCGIKEPFVHYPSWSWNEIHRLLGCAKTLELK
jgi:hypothetical protein